MINAERKHGAHIFHPWSYIIKFKLGVMYYWHIAILILKNQKSKNKC